MMMLILFHLRHDFPGSHIGVGEFPEVTFQMLRNLSFRLRHKSQVPAVTCYSGGGADSSMRCSHQAR